MQGRKPGGSFVCEAWPSAAAHLATQVASLLVKVVECCQHGGTQDYTAGGVVHGPAQYRLRWRKVMFVIGQHSGPYHDRWRDVCHHGRVGALPHHPSSSFSTPMPMRTVKLCPQLPSYAAAKISRQAAWEKQGISMHARSPWTCSPCEPVRRTRQHPLALRDGGSGAGHVLHADRLLCLVSHLLGALCTSGRSRAQ